MGNLFKKDKSIGHPLDKNRWVSPANGLNLNRETHLLPAKLTDQMDTLTARPMGTPDEAESPVVFDCSGAHQFCRGTLRLLSRGGTNPGSTLQDARQVLSIDGCPWQMA